MQTKKVIKKVCLIVTALVVCVVILCLGFWLIDGRSPQAYLVAHALPQTTMEDYEKGKGDMTDKSIVEIPDGVEFPREVKQYKVGGMQVFESPAEDDSKPIVLYIHGGAYVNNFTPQHWKAIAEWAETTGCGIVTPNYPLLFQYTAKDAHPLMLQLYKQLLERFPAKRIIIMGDSAGGGFSLALTQELKADSIDLPSRMILISPWVDVVGGDDALQEYDTFLNMKVLRLVGTDWAGDMDVHDPIISPLYGDMQGLPPTDLYAGTWETLYTDIIKTYDKMKAADVDVHLHVKEKMGHVYPLWPCPEGKAARKEIAEIIKDTDKDDG
jgi:acetyl esterase/lipase